ncbi:MAG: 16S rRNA (cytidine(1402)-2'-O)-methyltransferase [Chitinophagaceae bacterium]|nr:16S rRNA (cytidine(1402)-2'-O)-methyltransferase [Chitinophagaceae bacterium]MCW5904643.1 16S rRNA (cytidine(1402)-2'-O)-methyltransferase [Chitinophagaceae bacterium]
MLYIVPTPIGNLKDFTYRAVEVLQGVDVILCEDTRTSARLLDYYEINKPLSPYHRFNEHKIVAHLVEQMQAGKTFALITDAGTPGISDPAFLLVRACVKENIIVECLPGATAFVPALVNSALPASSFVFEGFLPPKKGRKTKLKQLAEEERTIIIYESPLRLVKTLEELILYFGNDRQCCVSRELTKMFEENKRGTLRELADYFALKPVRGEIVIVLAGKDY